MYTPLSLYRVYTPLYPPTPHSTLRDLRRANLKSRASIETSLRDDLLQYKDGLRNRLSSYSSSSYSYSSSSSSSSSSLSSSSSSSSTSPPALHIPSPRLRNETKQSIPKTTSDVTERMLDITRLMAVQAKHGDETAEVLR